FPTTKSEHKTFFARYQPSNGNYLLGQRFTARSGGGTANATRVKDGDIYADANGNVYLGGICAESLPLTFDPPQAGNPKAGAWLLIMNNDFTAREYVTRLCLGEVHSLYARAVGGTTQIVLPERQKATFYILPKP
ncbi:MAG: hypothetical protein HC896_13960, partial [Bacteroidales bacterium]|nr:hypothetical protein [Bacteroidales bacterium]